jgi:hypothetical protein
VWQWELQKEGNEKESDYRRSGSVKGRTTENIRLSTLPGDFKETVFLKNLMGSYTLDSGEQFRNLIFWISLEKKMLYAYTETTLNGKISPKCVYISVNNNTK